MSLMEIELRSKSDFVGYNPNNYTNELDTQKQIMQDSSDLNISLIKDVEFDTNRTNNIINNQYLLPEKTTHSYSCNLILENVEGKEEWFGMDALKEQTSIAELKDMMQKDKDVYEINEKLRNNKLEMRDILQNGSEYEINQDINNNIIQMKSKLDIWNLKQRGTDESNLSPHGKSNYALQLEQHPKMNFQKIRSILYELQQDQKDNFGISILENQYRNLFTYGRESDLTWKNQIIQHPSETKHLRIATLTWNLHGSCPVDNLSNTLGFLKQASHHIVAIGTQECERSIAASFFNSSKSKWEQAILDGMSSDYVKVHSLKMNALHLIVLSHKTLKPYIKNIQSDKRATGIGNYLGNKGGLGISFEIGKRSYLFVNLHLSSGKENIERRNKDFLSVENSLNMGKHLQNISRSHYGRVSNRFDYVFFIGDMNYRVNVDIQQKDINEKNYIQLLLHDQLIQEIQLIAADFTEGMITFPPTYKMDSTQNLFYSGKKKRQPAWTDRILYKSTHSNSLFQIQYDSNTNIMGSDHRPVYAQFLAVNILSSSDDQAITYSIF